MADLTILTILVIALVLFFSSLVRSTVGFGFGLVANPLLVLAGVPLQEAMAISAVAMAVQALTAIYRLRRHVLWRKMMPVASVAMLSMPLGNYLLGLLAATDKPTVRAALGAALLLVLAAQWWLRVEPRERVHPLWGLLTGLCSGVLAGMAGIGGPPIVIWVMAHQWTNPQTRASLWSAFVLFVPTNLILLLLRFGGDEILPMMGLGLAGVPITYAGMMLGLAFGNRLPLSRLRQLMLGLLVLLALSLILPRVLEG